MAYKPDNKHKEWDRILSIYKSMKHEDVPNTRILKRMQIEHSIYISYRTLSTILNYGKKKEIALKKERIEDIKKSLKSYEDSFHNTSNSENMSHIAKRMRELKAELQELNDFFKEEDDDTSEDGLYRDRNYDNED